VRERDLVPGLPYTDRLNYVSAILANIGYALAVEKLLGVQVPERCDAIRVLLGEISRIADHVTAVGAASLELGAMTAFLYAMEARELLWDLIEAACGRGSPATTSGSADWRPTCRRVRGQGPTQSQEGRCPLPGHGQAAHEERIFVDRMKDTGRLSKEDAIAYAVTGRSGAPPGSATTSARPRLLRLRALRLRRPGGNDRRQLRPLSRPHGRDRQSRRIIDQALSWMPAGPVDIDNPAVRFPGKDKVFHRWKS